MTLYEFNLLTLEEKQPVVWREADLLAIISPKQKKLIAMQLISFLWMLFMMLKTMSQLN